MLVIYEPSSELLPSHRIPINWLEEVSTCAAHAVLANSWFTRSVLADTFPGLNSQMAIQVLHPSVNMPSLEAIEQAEESWKTELPNDLVKFCSDSAKVFLSINRFERKKGLPLALQSLSLLSKLVQGKFDCKLVFAGGYDVRLAENREHLQELKELVSELGLDDKVHFVTSFSDSHKSLMLAMCCAVIYTPENEHFGIVPLESMAFGKMVIACNSGGPLESVEDGQTGLLCEATPEAFALAMERVIKGNAPTDKKVLRAHIQEKFGRRAFGMKLNSIVGNLIRES